MNEKLYCHDCGTIFEVPGTRPEFVDDWFGGHTEYWDCCPFCEGDDFEEADICEVCGDAWPPGKVNGGGLCPDCVRKDLIKIFEEKRA